MPNEKIKGIGGWLILPTIGFILAGLAFSYYTLLFLTETLSETGDIAYFGFIIYGAITFFIIFSLVLEFKKKKSFPGWAIFTMWITIPLLYTFLLIVGFEDLETEIKDLIGIIISNIIWTAYFVKSKRVKNTFVN